MILAVFKYNCLLHSFFRISQSLGKLKRYYCNFLLVWYLLKIVYTQVTKTTIPDITILFGMNSTSITIVHVLFNVCLPFTLFLSFFLCFFYPFFDFFSFFALSSSLWNFFISFFLLFFLRPLAFWLQQLPNAEFYFRKFHADFQVSLSFWKLRISTIYLK